MEWQPIETAPKDGTDIVLARFVRTENYLAVNPWIMVGSWVKDDFCVFAGIYGGEVTCITRFSAPWTHWMPLPEPPK